MKAECVCVIEVKYKQILLKQRKLVGFFFHQTEIITRPALSEGGI